MLSWLVSTLCYITVWFTLPITIVSITIAYCVASSRALKEDRISNKKKTTASPKLIIRDATVFDGLGNAPLQHHDIIVGNDGTILAVQAHDGAIPNDENGNQVEVIDADGKYAIPGLLDIHCHYDLEIEHAAGLEESLRHGVTTVVIGNCSLSAAVGSESEIIDLFARVENLPRPMISSWIKDKIEWATPKAYYEHVDKLPLGINVATFLGHSSIRMAAMGLEGSLKQPRPTKQQMQQMIDYVEEAMQVGYIGVSIDMLPWHRMDGPRDSWYKGISVPSQQAMYNEYKQISQVLRKHNAVLQATPNAGDKLSAVKLFMLSSSLLNSIPLRTTILAAVDIVGQPLLHWVATSAASFTNNILGGNVRFQALASPFLVFSDGMYTPFAEELGRSGVELMNSDFEGRKLLFKKPEFRKQFVLDWNSKGVHLFHREFDRMIVVSSPDPSHNLLSIATLSKKANKEPLEFFMDQIAEHGDNFRWKSVLANGRDGPRRRLLKNANTLPGFNDSGAHSRNMAFHDGALCMLRDSLLYPSWMKFEHALKRLTSESAAWLGIDRGVLAVGHVADIVLFDADKLIASNDLNKDPVFEADADGAMRLVKRNDIISTAIVSGNVVRNNYNFVDELGSKKFGHLLRRCRS